MQYIYYISRLCLDCHCPTYTCRGFVVTDNSMGWITPLSPSSMDSTPHHTHYHTTRCGVVSQPSMMICETWIHQAKCGCSGMLVIFNVKFKREPRRGFFINIHNGVESWNETRKWCIVAAFFASSMIVHITESIGIEKLH